VTDVSSTTRQRKYQVLTILLLLSTFSHTDRFALGVVLQRIKVDLSLSDTQLGFMTGIAFALFYAVMGVPIARWADRGNRITIISSTAVLWAAAVATCGFVGSFTQLLLVRIGVGVGEAGSFIPGFSLLADYFSRGERPRAVAIYATGGPLALIVGYLVAGWLDQKYGWRVMFMVLAAPGLVLALVCWATLQDPRRSTESAGDLAAVRFRHREQEPSLLSVCTGLWSNVSFRNLLLSYSIAIFFLYGIMQWQPTFFIRSYGLSSVQIGKYFAICYGLGGLLGTYLGGAWASRYAAHDERRQLRVAGWAMCGSALLAGSVYVVRDARVALALMGAGMCVQTLVNGPLYGTIQTVIPERSRALAMSLVMLCANLVGWGLGPLVAGVMSDILRPWFGEESLRYSLLLLSPGLFWAAYHAFRASKTVMRDVAITVRGTPNSELPSRR
jgi:MFS transporter, Spinster family, sphingosine-1-phosphate transporter